MATDLLAYFDPPAGVSTDTRTLKPGQLFFALRGPAFDGNQYAAQALAAGASRVVVDDAAVATSGDDRYLVVADALLALQQLATAYRQTWSCPVIALTGSNGKTTTKELLVRALATTYTVSGTQGNLNNHIGVPLTLLSTPSDIDVAVIEMGANHRGEIADLCRIAEPTHGFITNIGRAHLEGFGGPEGVRLGKAELFDYLGETGGIAFVDVCDPVLLELVERVPNTVYHASSSACEGVDQITVQLQAELIREWPTAVLSLTRGRQRYEAVLQLPGAHNFKNAGMAAAVAHYFKVSLADVAASLANYAPKNARSEERTWRGMTILFDAYNANPDSVEAALSWLESRSEPNKIAILGELAELGAFAKTAHQQVLAKAAKIPNVTLALVGESYGLVEANGHRQFATATEVTPWLEGQGASGDTVVLVKGSRSNRLEQIFADAAG